MLDFYAWIDYVVGKEWGANTGDIDTTFENLRKQSESDAIFITVLSAMREEDSFNTTKILVEIGELLAWWEQEKAIEKLNDLKEYHLYLLDKNFSDAQYRGKMVDFTTQVFQQITEKVIKRDRNFIPSDENDYSISSGWERISLKGFWEVFCAQFYKRLADMQGLDLGLIDISSQQNPIMVQESPEKTFLNTLDFFREYVWNSLISGKNSIIPGYIGGISGGIGNAIGEGYSDATAALAAVTIQERLKNKRVLLEILKSVPGIMSADPRMLGDSWEIARILEEINYWIAKEIVGVRWAQAKLLNPYTMLPPVIQSGVDIRLRDPKEQSNPWTLISHNVSPNIQGVQAILGRRNIAMISISSFSMNQWFIAKISQVIRKYASVDIIGTSETEFAFTVDMKSWVSKEKVHEMVRELKENYLNKQWDSIKEEYHAWLLFCIGHDMKQTGILEKAWAALRKSWISTNLVSQGLMQRALVLWVENEQDIPNWVQALHEEFWLSHSNLV